MKKRTVNRQVKSALALLLTVLFLCTLAPIATLAEGDNSPETGADSSAAVLSEAGEPTEPEENGEPDVTIDAAESTLPETAEMAGPEDITAPEKSAAPKESTEPEVPAEAGSEIIARPQSDDEAIAAPAATTYLMPTPDGYTPLVLPPRVVPDAKLVKIC